MRKYLLNFRTLSLLVDATPLQKSKALEPVDRSKAKFAFLTYNGAYRLLTRHTLEIGAAVEALKTWRDDPSIKLRTSSFRKNSYKDLEWAITNFLPRIHLIVERLEGDRHERGKSTQLAGHQFTGGPHLHVLLKDGTQRLIYFLGPKWSRRRIRNMQILLQIKAERVYDLPPQSIVIVDISRREIIEEQSLRLRDVDKVEAVAGELVRFVYGDKAS